MPKGIASAQIRAAVEGALVVDGDTKRTTRPFWELTGRARVRLAENFRDQRVEVEVWPNRTEDDPANYTARKCRVLSVAYNAKWSARGTAVLILEFELQTNKWDLALPTSWIHEIRTAPPITDEEAAEAEDTENDEDDEEQDEQLSTPVDAE